MREKRLALTSIRNNITPILANVNIISGDGLPYQVTYLNMTDPTQQCPSAWRLYNTSGVRAWGRPVTSGQSCLATFYPSGRQYSKVCGRLTGYQFGSPDAFRRFADPQPSSADDT